MILLQEMACEEGAMVIVTNNGNGIDKFLLGAWLGKLRCKTEEKKIEK